MESDVESKSWRLYSGRPEKKHLFHGDAEVDHKGNSRSRGKDSKIAIQWKQAGPEVIFILNHIQLSVGVKR